MRVAILSVCMLAAGAAESAGPRAEAPVRERREPMKKPLPEPADSPLSQLPVDPRFPQFQVSAPAELVASGPGDTLRWIAQHGTAAIDQAQGVAATQDGTYTVGYTQGSFDGHPFLGLRDFIVVKHNPSGTKLWSRQYGTASSDYAVGVATYTVTRPHSVYVAGYTGASLDGQPHAGNFDLFVTKLDESGTKLWTRQLGSASVEQTTGVATDSSGNVYVTGYTSASLDGRPHAGGQDLFLVKYNAAGVKQWTFQHGTTLNDLARAVATDTQGNIYVAGYTAGSLDGNPSAGNYDLFLIKVSPAGARLWTRQLGTSAADTLQGLATSRRLGAGGTSAVDVYLAGYTLGSFGGLPNQGSYDSLVFKYDASGNQVWARQIGTGGADFVYGLASDGGANLYITGATNYDLDTNTAAGNNNAFLRKLDSAGNLLLTRQLGSTNPTTPTMQDDIGFAVAADTADRVYVAGYTEGFFSTTASAGDKDLFVAQYADGCQASAPGPGQCTLGYGWGDPHLVTFDRVAYDFQGAGEFILTESTAVPSTFVVQGRMQSWGGSTRVSVFTAVATRVGTDRVGFYLGATPVRVNGSAVTLAEGEVVALPSGGRLQRATANSYVVSYPGAERLRVQLNGSYLDPHITLPASRQGAVRGLLGNFNGNRNDEFALRDGTAVTSPPSFAQLYSGPTSMAASWRITQAESLFDYSGTETSAGFDIPGFPSEATSVSNLTAAQQSSAQATCQAAGVTNPALLEGCILDVALTGSSTFASGASTTQSQDTTSSGGGTPAQPVAQTVYSGGFESGAGAQWSTVVTSSTPLGDRNFLGEFGNQTVRLSLTGLPAHTTVTVSFDLLLLQAWDGDGPSGPNTWSLAASGVGTLLHTTFSNTGSPQSYPVPGSAAGTGSAGYGDMLYPDGDSRYALKFTFSHSSSVLNLDFAAVGLQGLTSEAWGLDNVQVQVK